MSPKVKTVQMQFLENNPQEVIPNECQVPCDILPEKSPSCYESPTRKSPSAYKFPTYASPEGSPSKYGFLEDKYQANNLSCCTTASSSPAMNRAYATILKTDLEDRHKALSEQYKDTEDQDSKATAPAKDLRTSIYHLLSSTHD